MKRSFTRLIRGFLIFVLAVIVIFLAARYGWRLFGFQLCNSANSVFAQEITISDTSVEILGGTGDSFSSFVGYYSRQEGSNLYIGIKHNAFLGFLSRNGMFRIKIELSEPIEAIYFKDSKSERMIWNIDSSKMPVKETATGSKPLEGGESATEDDFPGASEDDFPAASEDDLPATN